MKKNYSVYEKEVLDIYNSIKHEIVKRIAEFKKIWKSADNISIFPELVFCLFSYNYIVAPNSIEYFVATNVLSLVF